MHDRHSREQGHKVACETLVLWGARGVIQAQFDPLTLWQAQCAAPVRGQALASGHFLAEEQPQQTAEWLLRFFSA